MNRLGTIAGVIFLGAGPLGAATPAAPATPAPQAHPGSAAFPLRFSKAPLGNVVRVFSARFRVPFSIEAHARFPITGDFTGDDLKTAVNAVARQAGLFAVPLGKRPSDGYDFSLHAPAPVQVAQAPAPVAGPPAASAPASALEIERANLLRERAKLLQAAARLGS